MSGRSGNRRAVDPRIGIASERSFEDAALRAVAKWQLEPGRRHGRAARFRMPAPVVFSLGD